MKIIIIQIYLHYQLKMILKNGKKLYHQVLVLYYLEFVNIQPQLLVILFI